MVTAPSQTFVLGLSVSEYSWCVPARRYLIEFHVCVQNMVSYLGVTKLATDDVLVNSFELRAATGLALESAHADLLGS